MRLDLSGSWKESKISELFLTDRSKHTERHRARQNNAFYVLTKKLNQSILWLPVQFSTLLTICVNSTPKSCAKFTQITGGFHARFKGRNILKISVDSTPNSWGGIYPSIGGGIHSPKTRKNEKKPAMRVKFTHQNFAVYFWMPLGFLVRKVSFVKKNDRSSP